jgi:hypothetical protein
MTIDRSSWWWRKGRALLAIFASLLAAGVVAEPLQNAAWSEVRSRQPELNLRDLGDNLGQGTLLGVLGGFRTVLADFVWLQEYSFWEQRDKPDTEAMIQLATTLDSRAVFFWDHGSDIIAYDIPAWTMRKVQQDYYSPDPARHAAAEKAYQQAYDEQARRGISLLDRGLKFHPGNYELLRDKAMIYQNRLKDLPDAAENWRLAAAAPDSPFFAARIYFRLLLTMGNEETGKKREAYDRAAYDYLRQFYPSLPADAPDAQKGVILDWLRQLEDVLKIPHDDDPKYAPPPGWTPDPDMSSLSEFFPELSPPGK